MCFVIFGDGCEGEWACPSSIAIVTSLPHGGKIHSKKNGVTEEINDNFPFPRMFGTQLITMLLMHSPVKSRA